MREGVVKGKKWQQGPNKKTHDIRRATPLLYALADVNLDPPRTLAQRAYVLLRATPLRVQRFPGVP